MAAIAARADGAVVTLFESTADGGRKILISGGGRCNVLPAHAAPERFVSVSPARLVRSILLAWPLEEQRAYFERELGVPLVLEAESDKYFPASNRARDVRDALVRHARDAGVEMRMGAAVSEVTSIESRWHLRTPHGAFDAERAIVATGGLSVPSTGSTGFGFDLARRLGHVVHDPYPALTPLTAEPAVHAELAGVSLTVAIEARSAAMRARSHGGFLFTHRGYSGPAVLDVSHVAVTSVQAGVAPAVLRVSWHAMSASAWAEHLLTTRGAVVNAVARHLPRRLADVVVREAGIPLDRTCVQLRREERAALVQRLTAYELPWTGHEGYRPAEVTGGGVALEDVRRDTLESVRAPGLYFCGEVLDAFGPIGGHNFQWAWSTGRTAGLAAASARA